MSLREAPVTGLGAADVAVPVPVEATGTAARARLAVVWLTAAAATVAATAAAVVAWNAGLGQEFARVGEAILIPACCVLGALILTSRPRHPVGRALLAGGAAWGLASLPVELLVGRVAAAPHDVTAAGLLVAAFTVRGLGWLVLAVVLPLLFPDGPSRRGRWWLRLAAADLALFALVVPALPELVDDRLGGVDSPVGLPADLAIVAQSGAALVVALTVACLVAGLVSVASRWRHGTPLVRQQVGLFATGLVVALGGGVALAVVLAVESGPVVAAVFGLSVAALPIAIGIAVLQHRLYEVDVLVNRTLLYLLLTGAVAAIYVLVVAGIGTSLDARGAGWLPWLATAVVAVAFQPLREGIQAAVNRLTFGAWQEPQEVVRSLHARLERAATPDGALREVLTTVRDQLRLDGLAVTGTDGVPVAEVGEVVSTHVRRLPLVHAGTPVGTLSVAGGRRRRRDDAVLGELAGALAPAVSAARLHADLLHSRERLVLAREEERRRLRRDLHDGLGPSLAGLVMKLDAARNLLGDEALLREMRTDVQTTMADVRRLVDGLRPVALDELGLVGSLRRLVDAIPPGGPAVRLVADGAGSPSAGVEVAAYRIVQEALTNVLRHSGASECEIGVAGSAGHLVVRITDDGTGAAARRIGGAGLETMRERAEEVGGSLDVEPRPGGGTVVRAVLPGNRS
jgi:signal transduction histidine kinase